MPTRLSVLLVAALPALAPAQFKLTIEWGGGPKPAAPPPAADALERRRPAEDVDRPPPAEATARPRIGIIETSSFEPWDDAPPRRPARAETIARARPPAADGPAPAPRREPAGGVILTPSPAGGPAGRSFRQPDPAAAAGLPAYHAGHDCPKCGYTSPAGSGTWVVAGVNADGTHTHRCPRCGASWRHARQ